MSLKERLQLDLIWFKLSYPFKWAHHPTCDPYSSQRFDGNIFGRKISLCQGCSIVTISSILTFVVLSIALQLVTLGIIELFLIILLPVLPVITIDGFSLSRGYKRIARTCLGISTGSALAVLVFYPSWIVKLGVVLGLISARSAYKYLRKISPSKDLCQDCELLSKAPYCPGMIDKMDANKRYQELALPIVNDGIQSRVENMYGDGNQMSSDKEMEKTLENTENNFTVVWVDENTEPSDVNSKNM